jgi:hypothetical protein
VAIYVVDDAALSPSQNKVEVEEVINPLSFKGKKEIVNAVLSFEMAR